MDEESLKKVEQFTTSLCQKSFEESEYFPIDRYFVLKHIDEINQYNPIELIVAQLSSNNLTYSVQFFCCLPEVWREVEYNDFRTIILAINSDMALYTLINFTFKYLEINIIPIIFSSPAVSTESKVSIKEYLTLQKNVLFKIDEDFEDFTPDCLGIDYDELIYLKQKLLLDERILPASRSMNEFTIWLEENVFN